MSREMAYESQNESLTTIMPNIKLDGKTAYGITGNDFLRKSFHINNGVSRQFDNFTSYNTAPSN